MNRSGRYLLGALMGAVSAASLLFAAATAWALPEGGRVVEGGSTISRPDQATMHIEQTTEKAIIDWQGYSIGRGETVRYFQPGSGSVSLNRVVGADPTHIYGQLLANGQVWVINPNGLLVGEGARINVGGFLASTLDIGNTDFMGGRYRFAAPGGTGLSSILNRGDITAADGGYAVLISTSITNEGSISTPLGESFLLSGDEVALSFAGNDLVGFIVDRGAAEEALGINNPGSISADGGTVILSAESAAHVMKTVVNNEGIITARTVDTGGGVIKLLGDMETGRIEVGGTLDASAPEGGDGGFVETSAAEVDVRDDLVVTTLAPYGATGTWLIDPTDYVIAPAGGDMTGSQLSRQLVTTSVHIQTQSAGTGAGDLYVADPVSWSSDSTLWLEAHGRIKISDDITATGDNAGLILGSNGWGSYSLATGASITLSGANPSLTIGGTDYTVINDVYALQAMDNDLSGYYALGSDIDASATRGWNGGQGFDPVADEFAYFSGTLAGFGHTITGLYINRDSFNNLAFITKLAGNGLGLVRDVGMVNVDITTSYGIWVGALVGTNLGSIVNSYSTGNVKGNAAVGGLVGLNYGDINKTFSSTIVLAQNDTAGGLVGQNVRGTITNSYSTGAVNTGNIGSSSYGGNGGLVGVNTGEITNSYSSASVTVTNGQQATGGLVGRNFNNGKITNSYSIGVVQVKDIYGGVSNGGMVGSIVGTATISNMTESSTQYWDFTNTWETGSAGPVLNLRWDVPVSASSSPGSTRSSSTGMTATDNASADRALRETLDEVSRRKGVEPLSPYTNDMKMAKRILDELSRAPLKPEESENHLAHLMKYLKRLTPEEASRLVLGKDPLSGSRLTSDDIKDMRAFLKKNYTDDILSRLEKARQEGASERWIRHLEGELAKYGKADENLRNMLSARQLEDGLLRAYYDRLPLGEEHIRALKDADPELRSLVAENMEKWMGGFEGEETKQEVKSALEALENGTLDEYAERAAEFDKRKQAAIEKAREAYIDMIFEMEKDIKTRSRALERVNKLDFLKSEIPRLERYVKAEGGGLERVERVKEIYRKMEGIQARLQDGTATPDDERMFRNLWIEASVNIDHTYETMADDAEQWGKDMKFWQGVAETTRDAAGNTLVALSAVTPGGTSTAAAAVLLKAGTAGFTKFIDSYYVKKDDAVTAAFNGIITTGISAAPGGDTFKQKMAVSFGKSLMAGYRDTLVDVAHGRVDPDQARDYFVKKVTTTYGKAVIGTLVGMEGTAAGRSDRAKAVIGTAARQFYDLMVKSGGGVGVHDVGGD